MLIKRELSIFLGKCDFCVKGDGIWDKLVMLLCFLENFVK